MLRGLYDFRPINEKTLGFRASDLLLFLEPHARDKNWLRVADSNGRIGFVPINFIQTTSEGLMGFLDEGIRRARRDRLPTVELLMSVRQNILTSPYTTEEHVAQIDREVTELQARAISELNYEEGGVGGINKKKHSSPRSRDQQPPIGPSLSARSPGRLGRGEYPVPVDPAGLINDSINSLGEYPKKNKKEKSGKVGGYFHPLDALQYPQPSGAIQIPPGHQIRLMQANNSDMMGEYVTAAPPPPPAVPIPIVPIPISACMQAHTSEGGGGGTNGSGLYAEPMKDPIHLHHHPGGDRRRSSHDALLQEPFNVGLLGAELVDIVRNATGLSHRLSQEAAVSVLNFVTETFSQEWNKAVQLLGHLEMTPRAVSFDKTVVAASADARNIRNIFNRLTQCKADEQQRSWALHEDEVMILDDLEKLCKLLIDADSSIPEYVMAADQYRSVSELVLYYQMETRWSIRTKLIQCFTAMCSIDQNAHSILLNSVLPMELAREIRESNGNIERMRVCTGILAILLSSGESIPTTHFDYLDTMFLEFLFEMIENPPNQDEKMTDSIMDLLFAYNLQFFGDRSNLIISTLEKRRNANIFTQKIIYFLNRGVDPVSILAHRRSPVNSVLKSTTDVFSSKNCADLFYTNDIKVLIDIVTRCVTDICPGDEARTAYLRLIHMIVRNSSFIEHKHRYDDLLHCFSSILQDEENGCLTDKEIVREVANEFPDLFGADLKCTV